MTITRMNLVGAFIGLSIGNVMSAGEQAAERTFFMGATLLYVAFIGWFNAKVAEVRNDSN